MFTGIVEEIGTIRKIDKGVSSCSITVQADKVLHGSQVGDNRHIGEYLYCGCHA